MSHKKRDQKRQIFFILVQPLHGLERIAASKTSLSIEIAATTLCVDEKPFLWSYHLQKLQHLHLAGFHVV